MMTKEEVSDLTSLLERKERSIIALEKAKIEASEAQWKIDDFLHKQQNPPKGVEQ